MNILERYKPVWAPEGGSGGGSSAPGSSSGGGGSSTSSGASAPSPAPSSPSSTPSESPASAREAQPSSAPSDDADLSFETIFGGPEGSPSGLEGEAPPVASPTAPTPPAAPPAAAAPAAETPVASGSVPAGAAAQVAPGTSPPPAPEVQLDPFNPGQLASHLASVEANAIDFVAQQMFALSPEDKEAIETDVVAHIPKMLARVFVKSQQNVLQQLDRIIPTMVQRHTEAMRRNTEGEDRFYSRWTNIGREHSGLVNSLATNYRQLHPSASLDQMIEDIGPIVMMAARIAPPSPGQQVTGQSQRPAAQRAANGRPPQPAPFVPAGSGAGPASQPKTNELNPWEAMFVGRE